MFYIIKEELINYYQSYMNQIRPEPDGNHMIAMEVMIQLLKMYPELPLPAWIPVEQELPKDCEYVLVTQQSKKGDRTVNRAYYADGSWHGSGMTNNVTAWIPLPEPYDV